jgi:hypothetical protein
MGSELSVGGGMTTTSHRVGFGAFRDCLLALYASADTRLNRSVGVSIGAAPCNCWVAWCCSCGAVLAIGSAIESTSVSGGLGGCIDRLANRARGGGLEY